MTHLITAEPEVADAEAWRPARPLIGRPQGSCFHQAIDRWRAIVNGREWRIAVGVVRGNPFSSGRHIHAWLENRGVVISAVMGRMHDRAEFYESVGVEADTVRLIKGRRIARLGPTSNASVHALLDAWGAGKWFVDEAGGVMPVPEVAGMPCRRCGRDATRCGCWGSR